MWSRIDYVVSGVALRQDILEEFEKGNIVLAEEIVRYDEFALLVKKYYDENVNDNSILFYDNTNYIDMLATSQILLQTENEWQNKHYSLHHCGPFTTAYCNLISGIAPAFCYDLDRQLKNNISSEKVNMWHNFFKNSLEKMQKYNIKRTIFSLPQESRNSAPRKS